MSGLTVKSSFGRQDKDGNQVKPQFVTGTQFGQKIGLDVLPFGFYEVSTANTAAANSTEYSIKKTSHGVKKGDMILLTSGSQDERMVTVEEVVDANEFTLGQICSASLVGATYNVYRPIFQQFDSEGKIVTTSGAIKFVKDSVEVEVVEDTVTPSNNTPLPVKITSVTGDINITAGDLNVQTSHSGVNYDSVRIGDGTDLLAINGSGEALVTASQSGTWNVNNISGTISLPTGAATESTLSTIDGKIPSNLTVSSTRLLVDGSGVTQPVSGTFWQATQPVSAASLPLPTGAATESTLTAINNKMAALGQTTMAGSMPVTIASNQTALSTSAAQSGTWNITNISGTVSLPTGAATESTLSAMSAKLPASLGIKTASGSLSIAPASDAVFSVSASAMTASYQEILNLTTSDQTFTAPANAKWCKVMADDTNVANIRVKIGGTATTSSGMQFQPGRSEDFNAVGNISVIAESGTNQKISVVFGV